MPLLTLQVSRGIVSLSIKYLTGIFNVFNTHYAARSNLPGNTAAFDAHSYRLFLTYTAHWLQGIDVKRGRRINRF